MRVLCHEPAQVDIDIANLCKECAGDTRNPITEHPITGAVVGATVETFPFFDFCVPNDSCDQGHDWTHRICPDCGEHVHTGIGTKTTKDYDHWKANHA